MKYERQNSEIFKDTAARINRERAEKKILQSIKIRCTKCHSKMIRVIDLYDDTLIGYSCEHCPHYNLLDQNVI